MFTPTFITHEIIHNVGLLKIFYGRRLVVFSNEAGFAWTFVVNYEFQFVVWSIAAYAVTDDLSQKFSVGFIRDIIWIFIVYQVGL